MITGSFLAILGLIAIVAHKGLARLTVQYDSELFRTKLGPRILNFANWLYVAIGVIMIIGGILAMLNVVPTK